MTERRTITLLGGREVEVVLGAPRTGKRQKDPDAELLSVGVRRTMRNEELIRSGVHPATGRPLLHIPPLVEPSCGGCAHHHAYTRYASRKKTFHKCDLHRLGESRSEASDIRVSWPACVLFEPIADDVVVD